VLGLQLFELAKNVCRSAGVVSAEFETSNDHPLPGHFMLSLGNVALGLSQALFQQLPIHCGCVDPLGLSAPRHSPVFDGNVSLTHAKELSGRDMMRIRLGGR
jgi:hypothetical protein